VKQVDLEPQEYRADIPNQKQPILGPNWQQGAAYLVGFFVMAFILALFR
jgi:hypothetical protein